MVIRESVSTCNNLNKVILREQYYPPSQQEIMSRLAGAKYFSNLDAKFGFWHMLLDTEMFVSNMNIQNTLWKIPISRRPVWSCFSEEVFHRTILETFNHADGCETDIDDFLVWGSMISVLKKY